jgi:hypothetical protein
MSCTVAVIFNSLHFTSLQLILFYYFFLMISTPISLGRTYYSPNTFSASYAGQPRQQLCQLVLIVSRIIGTVTREVCQEFVWVAAIFISLICIVEGTEQTWTCETGQPLSEHTILVF